MIGCRRTGCSSEASYRPAIRWILRSIDYVWGSKTFDMQVNLPTCLECTHKVELSDVLTTDLLAIAKITTRGQDIRPLTMKDAQLIWVLIDGTSIFDKKKEG